MNTKIRVKTQKVNDKTKHIMNISHINFYNKTATSQQKNGGKPNFRVRA
jgi:hypothetical protein